MAIERLKERGKKEKLVSMRLSAEGLLHLLLLAKLYNNSQANVVEDLLQERLELEAKKNNSDVKAAQKAVEAQIKKDNK